MINCVMSYDHIHIDSLIIDGLIERKEYIKMDNIYQHACKTCLWLMIVTTVSLQHCQVLILCKPVFNSQ